MGFPRPSRAVLLVGVAAALALATTTGIEAASATVVPAKTTVSAPQLQVLTIGDSIMNGFGLSDGQDWPTLLGKAENWHVTNLACDGAGVLQIGVATECDSDFAGVISAAASLHPDIVIFQGSSNDFGIDNDDLLAATIAEVKLIHTEFPNAQIVGLSMLWGYTAVPVQAADIDSQVKQAVEAVGGTYLDLGQPMSGHPELMQASDVHPTAAGQAVIEAEIQKDLQPVTTEATAQAKAEAERVALLAERVKLELVQ